MAPELFFIVVEALLCRFFLTTLTYFIAGHYWCLSLHLCVVFVFIYACVVYMCAHLQSGNPVFTVTPQQLMSSTEALLVSEACVNMCVSVCVSVRCPYWNSH